MRVQEVFMKSAARNIDTSSHLNKGLHLKLLSSFGRRSTTNKPSQSPRNANEQPPLPPRPTHLNGIHHEKIRGAPITRLFQDRGVGVPAAINQGSNN